MRTLHEAAIEIGLVNVPQGHARSPYGRIAAPGPDSSSAEVRTAEILFAFIWLFIVTSAVTTSSAPWTLVFVLAACFTTLVLARIDNLRRAANKRGSE